MMSDNDEAEATPAQDAVHTGQVYKIVFLKLDEQGAPVLWGARSTTLPAKVYDRRTAIKYATYEAQRLSTSSLAELLVAVVSPNGRCIAVLAGGTGKPVRPLVAMRTKRALVTLMPGDVKARRRSSRPVTRSIAKAARKRRMTGRGR
jgi:hypothetical protein